MNLTAVIQIIVLILLLFLSAYFSSAETAYSSVSKIHLKALSQDGDKRADQTLEILDNYTRMLSTILICNNIVNLSASALLTSFLIGQFGMGAVTIGTTVLTVLVILFGEITPKNLSKIRAEQVALADAPVISVLMKILTPVIALIDILSDRILKLLGVSRSEHRPLTETELKTYVDAGREDGVIEGREQKIIYNVFDFGDAVAKDIMVPRIDMTCIPVDATYDEIMTVFRREMFTRLPVYKNDPGNIIGHINLKDFILLGSPEDFRLSKLIHESYFTYEYKSTAELLKEMQQHSYGIAFVLDEFGTTVGMITLEDLVEEIVGDIRDEYDKDEEKQLRKYDDLTYLVDGSLKLDDLNDMIGSHFESEDFDSVGGLIIEKLERLPIPGEAVTLEDGTTLQAKGVKRNRIVKVLIRFASKPVTDAEKQEKKDREKESMPGSD